MLNIGPVRRCQTKNSFDASFPAEQRVPPWFGLNNHDAVYTWTMVQNGEVVRHALAPYNVHGKM